MTITAEDLRRQVEDQRVIALLTKLHGAAPYPLRSYLVPHEVDTMMLDAGCHCMIATRDLQIVGYAGKGRQAVEGQVRRGISYHSAEFWLESRTAFMELGGPLKGGGE